MSETSLQFYDRVVLSKSEVADVKNCAAVIYDEHGKKSTDVVSNMKDNHSEILDSYGIDSAKKKNLLSAYLSVMPFLAYIYSEVENNKGNVQNDIVTIYNRLLTLDNKRNQRDVDLRFSNIYLDNILESDNEIISDAGYDIIIEENEKYVSELKTEQSKKRTAAVLNYSEHIKKIDHDIIGGGSNSKGGYGVDLYNVFPDNIRMEDAAENWMSVYQIANGCSRKEAEQALDETAKYYMEEEGASDASTLNEHLENDAAVRYSEIVKTASYSNYQRMMNDPDMVNFDEQFRSRYPELSNDVYGERAIADVDAKRRLKKASQRYASAQQAVSYSNDNGEAYTLDADR